MDISQYYLAKKPGVITPNTSNTKKKTVKRKGIIEKYLKVQPIANIAQLLDVSPTKLDDTNSIPVKSVDTEMLDVKPDIIEVPDEIKSAQLAIKHLPKRETLGLVKPKQKKFGGNQLLLGPVNQTGYKIPSALSSEDFINKFKANFEEESKIMHTNSTPIFIPIMKRKKIFKQGEMEVVNQRKLLRRSSSFTSDNTKKRKPDTPDISDVASTLLMLESTNTSCALNPIAVGSNDSRGSEKLQSLVDSARNEESIKDLKRNRDVEVDKEYAKRQRILSVPCDEDETLSESETESADDMET